MKRHMLDDSDRLEGSSMQILTVLSEKGRSHFHQPPKWVAGASQP